MTNQTTPTGEAAPRARQQTLDFTGPERWEQFPEAAREACIRVLAQLLRQVISQQPEDNNDGR